MPIYEYECVGCSYRFERIQSFHAEPLKTCPQCGGSVHRVIQPVGVIFKGSGFYITDNRQISSPETKNPKGLTTSKESKTADKADC